MSLCPNYPLIKRYASYFPFFQGDCPRQSLWHLGLRVDNCQPRHRKMRRQHWNSFTRKIHKERRRRTTDLNSMKQKWSVRISSFLFPEVCCSPFKHDEQLSSDRMVLRKRLRAYLAEISLAFTCCLGVCKIPVNMHMSGWGASGEVLILLNITPDQSFIHSFIPFL